MTPKTMTVGRLLELLDDFDDNTPVYFTCDYGDRGHTAQALPINKVDELDQSALVKTSYSSSGYAIDSFNETETDELIVVLS